MRCSGNGCNGCGSDSCVAGQGRQFVPNADATPQAETFKKDGLTYLKCGGTEYVQEKCTHCGVLFWSRTDGPAMACCNLTSCIQAAVAGLTLTEDPASGGMMDESDGDEAAPGVEEETALSSAADNWGPEWRRKMRGQRPTQHELHVEVQRVAANSPAKGILCLLAWYTRVGSHLTVDQIARSVLVPPGPVEELLCHLELNGHIAQHSASGATTYSALPDALEHYLRWGHADRAATPTPAPAPAPVAEAPREGAPAAGPDPTGDARLAGDGDATPAEDAPAPVTAPARGDAALAVLTRDEGGTAPAPAPREGSPTPAEEETQGPAPKRRRLDGSQAPRPDVEPDGPTPGPEERRRGRSPAQTTRGDADAAAPAPTPAPPRRGRSPTPRTIPAGAAPAPAPRPRANSEPAPLAGAAPPMKKPRARARSSSPTPPDEDLRRGKWTPAEQAYAEKLIELHRSGRLPEGPERPNDGVGCRAWLATRLRCQPMRVTKKFVDFYKLRSYVHAASLTEDLDDEATELARLRAAFLGAEPGRLNPAAPSNSPASKQKRSKATVQGHTTRLGAARAATSLFAKDCGFAALADELENFERVKWADAEWRAAKWAWGWGPRIDKYQIPKSGGPLDAFPEAISSPIVSDWGPRQEDGPPSDYEPYFQRLRQWRDGMQDICKNALAPDPDADVAEDGDAVADTTTIVDGRTSSRRVTRASTGLLTEPLDPLQRAKILRALSALLTRSITPAGAFEGNNVTNDTDADNLDVRRCAIDVNPTVFSLGGMEPPDDVPPATRDLVKRKFWWDPETPVPSQGEPMEEEVTSVDASPVQGHSRYDDTCELFARPNYQNTDGAGLALMETRATVRVVGCVTGELSIVTSDGVDIKLVAPSEMALEVMPKSGCVELVGTVHDAGSVSPWRVVAIGDSFESLGVIRDGTSDDPYEDDAWGARFESDIGRRKRQYLRVYKRGRPGPNKKKVRMKKFGYEEVEGAPSEPSFVEFYDGERRIGSARWWPRGWRNAAAYDRTTSGAACCWRSGSKKQTNFCGCRLPTPWRADCGSSLCWNIPTRTGGARLKCLCPCRSKGCGASVCAKTDRPKRVCMCGGPDCGKGLGRRLLSRVSWRAFCADLTDTEIEEVLGYSSKQLRSHLLASYPGNPDEVADKWARGELQVEHIEPCALVFERKGPFVDADGNFTDATRYLNRLANLQLMDAHKNNVKDANFSGTTRRALEERECLLAGCDISTEEGFGDHLKALRVHVLTVSEIGAKGGRFRGEKYF